MGHMGRRYVDRGNDWERWALPARDNRSGLYCASMERYLPRSATCRIGPITSFHAVRDRTSLAAYDGYPFTPVRVMPWMKVRCATTKTRMAGSVKMTAAAIK